MEGNLPQHLSETEAACHSYESQLLKLHTEQAKIRQDQYLQSHFHNLAVIRRHTSIFERYSRFLPVSGAVLDWACNHAPDACLVRMLRGNKVQLYGCDVSAGEYREFFDFANLQYTQLSHPYLLPYDDNFFDAVIGSAALEHVPNDSESLKEMYRIIKPGGVLIVTTLPNRLSYTEWLSRTLRRPHHLRRYSLRIVREMFIHHGFLPVSYGYHQIFPSMCSTGGIFDSPFVNKLVGDIASQNKIGEKLWPIRCFASNLFIVGKKVASINNGDYDVQCEV
jgi:SAM-dependent methyltransferase